MFVREVSRVDDTFRVQPINHQKMVDEYTGYAVEDTRKPWRNTAKAKRAKDKTLRTHRTGR